MTLALFIKHTLIAIPVACVIWLVTFDRRAGYALLIAGVASITVGIVCCAWIFGPGFLSQLVSPRTYIIARAVRRSAFWMMGMTAFVAMLILLVRRFPRDECVAFCALYAGVATVVGAIFIGGDGINWNVMFDATWALCLSAAVALSRLAGSSIESRRIRVRSHGRVPRRADDGARRERTSRMVRTGLLAGSEARRSGRRGARHCVHQRPCGTSVMRGVGPVLLGR